MRTLSFTGEYQLRYPVPDVMRGSILTLTVLANVPFWPRYFPEASHAGHAAFAVMGNANQWWYLARTLFVDHRAYPLFSILFGFDMVIMASHTMERERQVVMETFTAEEVASWHSAQRRIVEESVEHYARCTAPRLIRRRDWWMLAFGLVHAVFLSGDIIGAYGLVAVVFAEVIVVTYTWVRVLIGVFIGSLNLLGIQSMTASMSREAMMLEFHDPTSLDAGYPLVSVASQLIATPMIVLTTLVVPCVMIGMGVARWGLLQDPHGRGALLSGIATCGLEIGALGGLPLALIQLDWAFADSAAWPYPLLHASGVADACGWLTLLALADGGPREKLGTAYAFLGAIDRRSMAAYLSQTLLFTLICGLPIPSGVRPLGIAVSGLTALVVWALIGLDCVITEAMGSSRNPTEWALRWLVAESAGKRLMPVFVPVPVVRSDVSIGVAQASSFPVAPVPASGVGPNGNVQGSTYDGE